MTNLISDLLTVSRIEESGLVFKKEKISFGDLIEQTIKEMEIFAKASNIEIKLKTEKNLPLLFTDPSQLKIVVENLLETAIRYISEGGQVKIELEKKDTNFHFKIEDNGVGIPKEDQKYIFQKFFRSRNALRHQTEGSGLGLYIAKSIIDKLKGKIGFQSREGKGSTFWFSLPMK